MPRIENLIGGLREAEKQLEARLDGIRKAIAALLGAGGGGRGGRRGMIIVGGKGKPKRRRLSAKGRAAISKAQKARWAKARAAK